ncbi:MAG: LysR family transcriptional regulator [Hyphomicrobium sp.]|nr:LysR family transcriptional regulator [Hyphomicrobium sp.]
MEMHQVRYFLAVARTLNFTRAAEDCHVAQPSLTRAVKLLEEELGGDLFRRERNFSHLTEFGQRMLPLLQQCYDSAAEAKQLAAALRAGSVLPLAIALSLAVDPDLIAPFLTALANSCKGLELRILRGDASQIGDFLKRGEVDIALAGPLGDDWGRLDSWLLFKEQMVLAAAANHSLSQLPTIHCDMLNGLSFIRRAHCERTADLADVLRGHNIELACRHSVSTESDCMAMVAQDLGVALIPRGTPRPAGVQALTVAGLDIERTVHCYVVAGRQRSAAAATLIKLLRAADWTDRLDSRARSTA